MLSRMPFSGITKAATKSHSFIKNHTVNRSLHLICQSRIIFVPNILSCKTNVETNSIRLLSTEVLDTFQIPDAPIVPTIINESPAIIENISELTQAGLGTSWPNINFMQHALEYLHVTAGLPWWGSIIAISVIVRVISFPLFVKSQRNFGKMSEYMPEFNEMQKKLSRARAARDMIAVERYAQELSIIMKGRELDPLKSLLPSLIQGGMSVSVFFALRRMTDAPLKSMEEGGLWWFTNLCIPDHTFILPLAFSGTLFFLMNSSAEAMPMDEKMKKIMIYFVPCVTLLISQSFPAGTLVFWLANNGLGICQQHIFKSPLVKKYFGLKDIQKPVKQNLGNSVSFADTFRQNMENLKITHQVRERTVLQDLERRRLEKALKESKRKEAPNEVCKKS